MGRPKKLQDVPLDVKELVTVAFAEDRELAEQYKRLLMDNNIPTAIQEVDAENRSQFSNIAILVPEELLDQAYIFLSQQAACDDFFDVVFGNQTRITDDWDDEA